MNIKQINEYFDNVFPCSLSEEWDNDGIMVCTDLGIDVSKVLVTLDVTDKAIESAIQNGCNLIISHHPLIFKPLRRIDDSLIASRVCELLENNISVLSYHTRFDSAEKGINSELAKLFELSNVKSFGGGSGFLGRIGDIEKEILPQELANTASKIFDSSVILYSGEKKIKKIGIVSGGGWDFVDDAIALGADAYITGEITYNKVLDFTSQGYTFIDAGHYPTEILCDNILKEHLIICGINECDIITFRHENPAQIV